jgi:hypothetical protein
MRTKKRETQIKPDDATPLLDQIKIWAVQAMFSDDELLEQLVLKGGNAMALVHRISARASIDLDFSLQQDFSENLKDVTARISKTLSERFRANGYEVFDLKLNEQPKQTSEDMKHFWGGYSVEFKLTTAEMFAKHPKDVASLRRKAVNLGQGTKFLIDISRFEYVTGKQQIEFEDGYLIYVYSLEMIVCEKLRAICQQMPAYGTVIKRSRPGTARARDFVDIFVLMDALKLDLTTATTRHTLAAMFASKNVPLSLLDKVADTDTYEFHLKGFPSVQATVTPDFQLEDFDFYFQYTVKLIDKLKPFWHE